ncbi:unnamed protein product, partial [Cyprideis torosa]
TLSIIAYKQPVEKSELEKIRGVSCDYSIQKLLEKELVEIIGRSEGPGRPLLYSTSEKFMDYFGLKSIQDLPKTRDISTTQNSIGEESIVEVVPAEGIKTSNQKIIPFDLKDYLFMEMILKEKDFRAALKDMDWTQYQDAVLTVFCSSDAIIPPLNCIIYKTLGTMKNNYSNELNRAVSLLNFEQENMGKAKNVLMKKYKIPQYYLSLIVHKIFIRLSTYDFKFNSSKSALETLSIIAYKQPVEKSELEKIR